jgi:polar amino acid transport system substrate-binding protein
MDVPWQLYYSKELVLRQSRSYGPGRYDPSYELGGQDYPIGYVRWTENRNMQSVLELIASGRVNVLPLVTHRFPFARAAEAYELLAGDNDELYVGILLNYDVSEQRLDTARRRTLSITPRPADQKVRLGVIGAGNFARTMLLPHLNGKTADLVSVATSTGISARDTARKFGFRSCTTDYQDILQSQEIDAVIIATRHDLHGVIAKQALEAGKHVYVEKPLCLSEEQLVDIASAYRLREESGDPPLLTVGFNRRFAPMVRAMKRHFRNRHEPMVMTYRVNAGFIPKDSWYQNPSVGGGRIIGEVCHFLDTLQYICDSNPVRVSAQAIDTANQAVTPADNVIISVTFEDGSVGSITYLANGDPAFPKEYIEVFAEGRVAVLDNFTRLVTMSEGRKKTSRSKMQDKGHKDEMRELLATLSGEQPSPISFSSIFGTTMATFRILQALATQANVDVLTWR